MTHNMAANIVAPMSEPKEEKEIIFISSGSIENLTYHLLLPQPQNLRLTIKNV